MLLPSLDTIKRERERLRLSQKQLANMANVSTSMINQIESGRCKPSYETAKRIFEKLTNFEESQSETAEDICTWNIVKLKVTNTIDDAKKKKLTITKTMVNQNMFFWASFKFLQVKFFCIH